jgi:bromodomain-containing protein 7/9
MVATAAKTFNPVGTIPHNAAIKMYNQGVKQIDRIRDFVITPHPSRAGSANNWRDGSVMSGREATAALEDGQPRSSKADIPPPSYIPEEMLAYPPNTGAAKMVGWNLNGGKRVYLKKITRGRERFTGKWRLWDLDGTRDVAEMDDPEFYFDAEKTRSGLAYRSIVNWKETQYEKWWEYEGLGGSNGQPPLPNTALPKRPTPREKPLTAYDFGVYPDIDTEMATIGKKINIHDETAVLYTHLNAPRVRPSPPVPHNFVNLFEDVQNRQPIDYMREFATGDVTGEAYTRSIDRFIQGAIAGRTKPDHIKADPDSMAVDIKPDPDSIGLEEYVRENYGYGILSKDFEQRPTIRRTIKQATDTGLQLAKSPTTNDSNELEQMARASFARIALRHMTRHTNALDIVPLIRIPGEFTWQGIGGKGDIDIGLKWVAEYQARAQKVIEKQNGKRRRDASPHDIAKKPRIEEVPSTASSPLSAAPGSPVKEPQPMGPTSFDSDLDLNDGENGMKRIRLELLALTKFYPLAALRKMDKAQAEKLLPPNVRALMTNVKK